MSIIKLDKEGDTLTARVKDCEPVKGNFGMQVKFTFDNGDVLFVGKDTADRQLLRAGFDNGPDEEGNPTADYAGVAGSVLEFRRDPNKTKGAKPYWSIEVSSEGAAKQSAAPSKRIPPPSPAEAKARTGIPDFDDIPLPDEPPELQGKRGDFNFGANVVAPAATPASATDVTKYTDLMTEIAERLGCAVTEPNVQGAAATLWIQWHRR